MMPGIHPVAESSRNPDGTPVVPDVFLDDLHCQITLALSFFRLKHLAEWGAPITLHPWDTWDRLGDRLGARLGLHVWHPSHWDAYYAALPDIPASTPGAVPLTMAMVRQQRREAQAADASPPDGRSGKRPRTAGPVVRTHRQVERAQRRAVSQMDLLEVGV